MTIPSVFPDLATRVIAFTAAAVLAIAAAALLSGCASNNSAATGACGRANYAAIVSGTLPATAPAEASDGNSEGQSDEEVWKQISSTLGKKGSAINSVYTVTIPRDDLSVSIEGMYVPTEAGVESVLHFYHCSCGKTTVLGAFCVTDYELNDVIDALRAGNIEVASTSQMLIRSQTNPLIVRFQGEGKADDLARTLASALKWMGKERNDPNPLFNR